MRENEDGPLYHIQKFTKNVPNTNGRAKTTKSLEEKNEGKVMTLNLTMISWF